MFNLTNPLFFQQTKKEEQDIFEFIKKNFGYITTYPFADWHKELLTWFSNPTHTKVVIAPRGSAKSSTTQLGISYLANTNKQNFILYVSATQDQVNEHIKAVADLLEQLGLEPLVGENGNKKGWRANLVRTGNFSLMGISLEKATRGIKLGILRPTLIILDDCDETNDSDKTTKNKIELITKKILPMGSQNTKVLFIQNLISKSGIASKLIDKAEFLTDREITVVKAIEDLVTEEYQENGQVKHKIVSGRATWEGQSIEVCEKYINQRGLKAFLAESQHEFTSDYGLFFDTSKLKFTQPEQEIFRYVRSFDLAATQGGGDYTVATLLGQTKDGSIIVLDSIRVQLESSGVDNLIHLLYASEKDLPNYQIAIPQDPGAAGKMIAEQYKKSLGATIVPQTGSKAVRAKEWARMMNSGAVYISPIEREPVIKSWLYQNNCQESWISEFIEEHKFFSPTGDHLTDDIVDSCSAGIYVLLQPKRVYLSA